MAVGILSYANNAGEILDIFFDTIFASCYCYPISEDPYASARLRKMIQEFTLGSVGLLPHAEIEQKISGGLYRFEQNPYGQEAVSFNFMKDRVLIRTVSSAGEKEVYCGLSGEFLENDCGYILTDKKPEEIADTDHNFGYDVNRTLYTGGFKTPNIFEFRMRSESFLSDHRYSCEFVGDMIEIRISNNTMNSRMKYRKREEAPDIILRGRYF